MGFRDRLRRTPIVETVQETVPAQVKPVAPLGFDPGIPRGGTSRTQPGGDYPTDRQSWMEQLFGAYTGCPWASACVDAVANTVAAGGVQLVPDADADDPADAPTQQPPQVQRLQALLDTCNPHQDIRQLLRGIIIDLEVFGDSFIEVVWLLGEPVALYPLDAATMSVNCDEHGVVHGYWQTIDTRTVDFKPEQVIHIQLESPRGGPYGLSPTQKALIPITAWLFTAATLKETMRKGDPPTLAIDFPLEISEPEVARWQDQYQVRHLGAGNIGRPIGIRGAGRAAVHELKQNRIAEYLAAMDAGRDTILSTYGVPPAQVGVIESGNLGGGTGTSQFKTFKVTKCAPRAELVLEKLNYHLTRVGFGVEGWKIVIPEVDWRDDKTVEEIRDTRLRNGTWTLNQALRDLDLPTVGPAGDVHVLVDRQNLVVWDDIEDYSKATVAGMQAKGTPPEPAVPGPAVPEPPAQPTPIKPPSEDWQQAVAVLRGLAVTEARRGAGP